MPDERRRSAAIGCAVGVAAAGMIVVLAIDGDSEPVAREPTHTSARDAVDKLLEDGPTKPSPPPGPNRIRSTTTVMTPAKIDADLVKAQLDQQLKALAEANAKAKAELEQQAAAALKAEQEADERDRKNAEAGVFPALSDLVDKKNSYGGLIEAGNNRRDSPYSPRSGYSSGGFEASGTSSGGKE